MAPKYTPATRRDQLMAARSGPKAEERRRQQERSDFNRALEERYPKAKGYQVKALTQGGNWTTIATLPTRRKADERAERVRRVYPGRYRAVTVEKAS